MYNADMPVAALVTTLITDMANSPDPPHDYYLSPQKASDHNALHAAVLCDATLPLWALPHYALPLLRPPPMFFTLI